MAAVNALFVARRKVDYAAVPRVAFTDPEVAAVGLTQAEAASRWQRPKVVSFEYAELDRAIIDGQPYGFVTLVGDRNGAAGWCDDRCPWSGQRRSRSWRLGSRLAPRSTVSPRACMPIQLCPRVPLGANAYVRERYARPGVRMASRAALRILIGLTARADARPGPEGPVASAPRSGRGTIAARGPPIALTGIGLLAGLGACVCVGTSAYGAALGLWLLNRLLDGLDGAVARRRKATDLGGVLDFVADFVVYAGFIVGVAIASTGARVACLMLLAAYWSIRCAALLRLGDRASCSALG